VGRVQCMYNSVFVISLEANFHPCDDRLDFPALCKQKVIPSIIIDLCVFWSLELYVHTVCFDSTHTRRGSEQPSVSPMTELRALLWLLSQWFGCNLTLIALQSLIHTTSVLLSLGNHTVYTHHNNIIGIGNKRKYPPNQFKINPRSKPNNHT